MKKNLPKAFIACICMIICSLRLFSQTYTPVAISGFNQDVVAESGTSSLTTTTISLDGFNVSNKVIYTNTFKTVNGFGGGGIPDNGVITDAAGSYQLPDYAANNALLIQRGNTGDINITTPAKFDHIRILSFSTEGTSLINATLFFSDGTSTNALTNYPLSDWFFGTTNLVLAGIGRCTRATPASGDDAYPNDPRMYYIDIPISCADRQKDLQRINLTNVTTAGNNAPYPNAVFMAVSATSYNLNVTPSPVDATCNTAGSITLAISGSSAAYNVTWNTIPVQNGLTASGLTAGTYVATITDLDGCISTDSVTISRTNNLTLTANNNSSICFGGSFTANTVSNATSFSWSPAGDVSDPTIANPVLSPATTTTYTVTGFLGTCSTSGMFTLSVNPEITLSLPSSATVCPGNTYQVNTVSNATAFHWTPAQGISDTAIANPVITPAATTTYFVTASTGQCSTTDSLTLSLAPAVTVNAGNDVSIAAGQSVQLSGSGDAGTYLWTPATGLSAVNILNPVANPSAPITYTLTITNALGCSASDMVDVNVNAMPECAKPMNAITPNGDGINDKWLVTNGSCPGVANVKVFNRYGSPVFEADNYQNNWEGTYKGKSLPDGTYYFVIEFRLNTGRMVMVKGDLTILR